jgi:hypothetical protein
MSHIFLPQNPNTLTATQESDTAISFTSRHVHLQVGLAVVSLRLESAGPQTFPNFICGVICSCRNQVAVSNLLDLIPLL